MVIPLNAPVPDPLPAPEPLPAPRPEPAPAPLPATPRPPLPVPDPPAPSPEVLAGPVEAVVLPPPPPVFASPDPPPPDSACPAPLPEFELESLAAFAAAILSLPIPGVVDSGTFIFPGVSEFGLSVPPGAIANLPRASPAGIFTFAFAGGGIALSESSGSVALPCISLRPP